MNKLDYCVLTGIQFENSITLEPTDGSFIEYTFNPVGKVKIALPTLIELINNKQYQNPLLAGICRNCSEDGIEPPLITGDFIKSEIKNYKIPNSFKEKCRHLLKYMYDRDGKNFKDFNFSSLRDYPICYANDNDEFNKIMDYLKKNYLLNWKNSQTMAGKVKSYWDVQLTDGGIEEVEKELPNIPMIGLVYQEVSSGNSEVDTQINHAKDLFFQAPQTFERMRSACETLSYVLEPFRKDLKKYFKSKDTEDFFLIVNNFDIRHNKESTKDIQYEEQLEWIFYSLLNTINTFTKLKKKFEL